MIFQILGAAPENDAENISDVEIYDDNVRGESRKRSILDVAAVLDPPLNVNQESILSKAPSRSLF